MWRSLSFKVLSQSISSTLSKRWILNSQATLLFAPTTFEIKHMNYFGNCSHFPTLQCDQSTTPNTKPGNSKTTIATKSSSGIDADRPDSDISHTPQDKVDGIKPRYSAKISSFDKWTLVFTNTYPNKESIPNPVPASKLASSRDKLRAKAAIYLTVACFMACIAASFVGNRRRRAGTAKTIDVYAEEKLRLKTTIDK